MPELNSSDRYEIIAELYRRQFGELAPGKDRSPLAGCQSVEEAEENRERWLGWLATHQPVERAVEKIQCMQHQAEQREQTLRDASDAKDELRARIALLEGAVEWCLSNHAGHLYAQQNWNDHTCRYQYAWTINTGSGNPVPGEFVDILKVREESGNV